MNLISPQVIWQNLLKIRERKPLILNITNLVVKELAMLNSNGPGSLKAEFLDKLYNIKTEELEERLKIEVVQ